MFCARPTGSLACQVPACLVLLLPGMTERSRTEYEVASLGIPDTEAGDPSEFRQGRWFSEAVADVFDRHLGLAQVYRRWQNLQKWSSIISSGSIDEHKEQEILGDFLNDVFCELLGYSLRGR